MTHDNTYDSIKADVLAGMSGYAAARKNGVDSLKYARRLADDPDIVAAKSAGTIKERAKWKTTPEHYRRLPHVVDVLDNGMTQVAAATKHGVSQPLVNRHVKQALGGQPALKAAAKRATPEPTAPTQPTNVNDINLIADLVRAHAQRLNIPAKTLLNEVANLL